VFETLADSGCDLVVALDARASRRCASIRTITYTAAMATKLQTDKGKASYRRRKWIAEPPNGWIKNVLGSASSACAGCTVFSGVELVCMALNLRRMAAMHPA